MTVAEATEILKSHLSDQPYFVSGDDEDHNEGDVYGFLFDGEYRELGGKYVFVVYDTKNGAPAGEGVFPCYVDKATRKADWCPGPPVYDISDFSKKADAVWTIDREIKRDEPVEWTPELLVLAKEYETAFAPVVPARHVVGSILGSNEDRVDRIKACLAAKTPIPEREYLEMD
ncbi:MAG: hypothetical protein LBL73_09785 [Synergistaceae bacterium]|jgi:hypothetical protein|nr:hypothetical protein [Synergistaceae bacterium]